MIIEIFIALIIGVVIGTLTGLSPGIHINLVAGITMANIGSFSQISPISVSVFIASLSITHTFIDFIPSVFLGAPNDDTILSVLPGHTLLKQGKGYEAVLLTLQGAIIAIIIGIACIPIYILFLGYAQSTIYSIIPFILIFISAYIIFRETNPFLALISFVLAGFVGFFSFNLPVKDSLLPLLTGLFGCSGIITSLQGSESIPPQKQVTQKLFLPKKKYLASILSASIIGPIFSFLPGIGSSHIAIVSSEIIKHDQRQFLFLNGISSTLAMFLSFIAAYSIGKTRTGSAATIKEILGTITSLDLTIIVIGCILSAIFAYIIGIFLAKKASIILTKLNYKYINLIVLGILLGVNIFLTNYLGLLVLATSTAIGIYTIQSGVRRINLMGALLIPTILYYLVY